MILSAKQLALREYYQEVFKEWETLDNNLQNVFTPYDLCEKMIDKVCKYCELKGKKILVTNLEFAIVLIERGIDPKDICFLTDCEQKAKFGQKIGVEIMSDDFFDLFEKVQEKKEVRTWDAVIGNPPYQLPQDRQDKGKNGGKGRGKSGSTLWDKFVVLSHEICVDNGYVALVHPSRWRKPNDPVGDIIKSKSIKYLEIHGLDDGMKTFGCQTRYDWYIVQNCKPNQQTEILDEKGEAVKIDVSKWHFIPNFNFDFVKKVIAVNGNPACEVLHSYSEYETRKAWMSKEQDEKFKYPCVYSINSKGKTTFWYSSIKKCHFGVPKVVFPSGAFQSVDVLVDDKGKYGLTQFAKGIVDKPEDLDNIAKALKSQKFLDFYYSVTMGITELDKNVISCLRKDFWKEFVK